MERILKSINEKNTDIHNETLIIVKISSNKFE